jgi:proteasome accessory factor A
LPIELFTNPCATRDEPHADAERFRRLHVIVGDSNMSETTTLLKVGSTDLVLRMIEAGAMMRDLTLDNAIRAIREVSHDMTGRSRIRLASAREFATCIAAVASISAAAGRGCGAGRT